MTPQGRARMLRRIVAFVVAVGVMVILGSAAHSYFVQQAWSIAAGHGDGTERAAIPFADRVSWAVHDLGGMIQSYATLSAIALLLAFLVAGVLTRFTGRRVMVFGLSGAVALFTLFTVLRMVLGTVGIFGARGAIGVAAQMAAGLLAGVLFARLTAPTGPSPT
jgi:hypothetical protein